MAERQVPRVLTAIREVALGSLRVTEVFCCVLKYFPF